VILTKGEEGAISFHRRIRERRDGEKRKWAVNPGRKGRGSGSSPYSKNARRKREAGPPWSLTDPVFVL